ncbi:MAG: PIN domain-containing protein [Austwickia sp.]|nr:PIN domain-containing protein [Actinomycetota bacterium]MCB1251805.1 PIN domain-containing protein [Austwickia sp.]
MAYSAILDANVLVPSRVRDVLLSLAHGGLYLPLWSESILAETTRHLPGSMPQAQRSALIEVMSGAFPEALVACPPGVTCDAEAAINAKDRHVLRAAILGEADVVVTEDVQFRAQGGARPSTAAPGPGLPGVRRVQGLRRRRRPSRCRGCAGRDAGPLERPHVKRVVASPSVMDGPARLGGGVAGARPVPRLRGGRMMGLPDDRLWPT